MITEEQFSAAESEVAAMLGISSGHGFPDRNLSEGQSTASATRITRAIRAAQAEAAAARRIGKIMARVQSEYVHHNRLK